ncbi:MAG: hypothetical protein H7Z73_00330 [Candidatus Saccharibacteria bacterium]|nr:hypothetical protein [Moraxellaceae bacterium]
MIVQILLAHSYNDAYQQVVDMYNSLAPYFTYVFVDGPSQDYVGPWWQYNYNAYVPVSQWQQANPNGFLTTWFNVYNCQHQVGHSAFLGDQVRVQTTRTYTCPTNTVQLPLADGANIGQPCPYRSLNYTKSRDPR